MASQVGSFFTVYTKDSGMKSEYAGPLLLDTYELSTVFETSELISSLAKYSDSRLPIAFDSEDFQADITSKAAKIERSSSILFLHIMATADYFTMNQTLMEHVPPVFVDIILDPFVFNVLPKSLIPIVLYIVVLAIGSWYLSKYIIVWISAKEVEFAKKTN